MGGLRAASYGSRTGTCQPTVDVDQRDSHRGTVPQVSGPYATYIREPDRVPRSGCNGRACAEYDRQWCYRKNQTKTTSGISQGVGRTEIGENLVIATTATTRVPTETPAVALAEPMLTPCDCYQDDGEGTQGAHSPSHKGPPPNFDRESRGAGTVQYDKRTRGDGDESPRPRGYHVESSTGQLLDHRGGGEGN